MLTKIRFKNFKVLRDAELPLGRFTLIVGPNGSGKSTALQAIRGPQIIRDHHPQLVSKRARSEDVELALEWMTDERFLSCVSHPGPNGVFCFAGIWKPQENAQFSTRLQGTRQVPPNYENSAHQWMASVRIYSFEPNAILTPTALQPKAELGTRGENLVGVLDRLRDEAPERFEALNSKLHSWLPEFDRVLFETPKQGHRAFRLRLAGSTEAVEAASLSQGTLLALAMLTLAYLPDPPLLVGLEEPDRGIHPRLLRDVQDALYRLSHPEAHEEARPAIQVVATTHSPYFLDLFRDHPEEIILAQKEDGGASFQRLLDCPNAEEILSGTPLGEVWYSGVLGGVPAQG